MKKISQYILNNYCNSSGINKKLWYYCRKIILCFIDPVVSITLHNKRLYLPFSHTLPLFLNRHPHYDKLLLRINTFIHCYSPSCITIDVGANVGDSICAVYQNEGDKVLAIEPNASFSKYLLKNWKHAHQIVIENLLISDHNSEDKYNLIKKPGTTTFLKSTSGEKFKTVTLDSLLDKHVEFKNFNFVKIDTDGHDFKVLQGSLSIFKNNKPIILFECDIIDNQKYFEMLKESLENLNKIGYNHFLVYDNFGCLMGIYSIDDLRSFYNLIFYHITSSFSYFDILFIRDDIISEFYEIELKYFLENIPQEKHTQTKELYNTLIKTF